MRKTPYKKLSRILKIDPSRTLEAQIKAKLISAVLSEVKRSKITHVELSRRSGIPRSSVTGILGGSLQKVTLDRILRLLQGVNLRADVVVKKAA